MKILVTGATGFIGGAFVKNIAKDRGNEIVAAIRKDTKELENICQCIKIGEIDETTRWESALAGVDIVIHSAARVHHNNTTIAEFRKTNLQGSINLARQAASSGVKRFIFISSIKASGETTRTGKAFSADSVPLPTTAYGISKMEAEIALMEIGKTSTMEVVIIRPPLVYGKGAKGSVAIIEKLINSGLPLPFGSLNNKRSFVSIDNLVDLITVCISHPAAANQIFLASDGKDISTEQFIKQIASAMGKAVSMFPFPPSLLNLLLKIIGKDDIANGICGSAQVDIAKNKELLGWSPH